jgi:YVTN family beta-propeller protein
MNKGGNIVIYVTKRQKLTGWLVSTLFLFGFINAEVFAQACMIYVSNSGDNTVSVIDASNNSVVATIPVGSAPSALALNTKGTRVYVANTNSNSVSVIDTSTNQVLVAIMTQGYSPTNVVVSSDGTRVYVSNTGNRVISSNFSVIDTASNTVIATTTNLATTLGGGISMSTEPLKTLICGTFSYVANSNSNTVSVTNVYSKNTVATIPVGKNPKGLAAFVPTSDKPTTDCAPLTQSQMSAIRTESMQACKINPASCGISKINGISANAFVSPTYKITAGIAVAPGGLGVRTLVRATSIDGMVDPKVEIYTHPYHKLLHSNRSWIEDPYATTELAQKGLIPPRATDAATVVNLPAGLFTMEVTSENNESGLNIIEIYDMAVFP